MKERFLIWYSSSRLSLATLQIWTSTPLSPFTTTIGPNSVKIPPSPLIKVPLCKSNTFKASYFNRLVKIWNYSCKILPPTTFATLSSFKRNIRSTYKHLLGTMFDIEMPCTWSLVHDCPCHRT